VASFSPFFFMPGSLINRLSLTSWNTIKQGMGVTRLIL
jgi:hypothetical protein